MVSYVQSLLANFVSAYYRITTWPPQKKISFFLFPAPLGQICFVLVLISPNHKARNRYPEMVMARTGCGTALCIMVVCCNWCISIRLLFPCTMVSSGVRWFFVRRWFRCFLIVGIHASGISVPLSCLCCLG